MTNVSNVLGLYGGGRNAGVGVVVGDADNVPLEQCTIFGFGQHTKTFEALALLAKWISRYNIEIICIGNGAMFQMLDRLVSLLIERYPDMKIKRLPIDETGFNKDLTPLNGALTIASAYHQKLQARVKWPQKKPEITTLLDLKQGMILEGMVTQIRPFGAFIDIGINLPGLMPFRAMPKALQVAEVVSVCVTRVDLERRQVGLNIHIKNQKPQIKKTKPPLNTTMADALKALKRGSQ